MKHSVSWRLLARKVTSREPKKPKARQLELNMAHVARNSVAVETACAAWRRKYAERMKAETR